MSPKLPLQWLGVIAALGFLLPNHYSPWLSFHQEAAVAIAFIPIIFWALFQASQIPRVALAIALLAFTPLLQWMFGVIPYLGDATVYTVYLLGWALSILAGHAVSDHTSTNGETDQFIWPLWLAFIFAGIVSVGMAVHQWLNLGVFGLLIADLPPGGRPFANLAQPNHLATLLVLASVGIWYGWEKRWLGVLSATLAISFFVVGMVLTGSRSVWLAVAWLVPLIAWGRQRCGLRLSLGYLLAVVVVFFLLSFLKPFIDEWLSSFDTGAAIDRLGQTNLRLLAWRAFFDAALLEPWWGYGWGQIAEAQFRVALEHPGLTDIFYNTHNLFLDLLIWLGFPLAGMVIVGSSIYALKKLLDCRSVDSLLPFLAVGIVIGHSMVEFPIAYAYFLMPIGFFMGVVAYSGENALDLPDASSRKRIVIFQRNLVGVIAVSTFALFVQICREYLPYEDDWREQQFVQARISGARTNGTAQVVLLDQLEALMRLQRYIPLEQASASDLKWLQRTAERYPYPAFRYKYAVVLAANGQHEAAVDQLARICAVFSARTCQQVKSDWLTAAASKDARLSGTDLSRLP